MSSRASLARCYNGIDGRLCVCVVPHLLQVYDVMACARARASCRAPWIAVFVVEVYLLEQRCLTSAIQNMVGRFGICLSFIVAAASSDLVSPGAIAALYGDVVAHSDYTLKLQPPEENTHEVEASLDAIMKAEDEKRISADRDFAAAKQRLIDSEKQQVHDIVREAFSNMKDIRYPASPGSFLQSPTGNSLRQNVKDIAYPTSSESGLGDYERKTQSPMVWINLHKTDLTSPQANPGGD